MKWPTFVTATVLTVGLTGCGFFGGDEEETPAAAETATAVDTTTQTAADLEEAPALEQEPAGAPAQPTRTQPAAPAGTSAVDMPWTPTQAGTVDPGMTREQVVQAWGEPAAERALGEWVYMHYRNGCEVTCGTDDVVLLQGGQVVDAIVRWQGHTYSGVSSSPPGREAEPTLPSGNIG